MKFSAVLFDLDGTLLDTLTDLAEAANAALAARGYPLHPVAAYREFVGDGVEMLARRILPVARTAPEEVAALVADFRGQYAGNWHNATRSYDGINEMLDVIAARGLPMLVLSNKPDDFTRLMVDHYFARWQFAAVAGVREGMKPKPDPAAALAMVRALGAAPAEVLYLGDTGTDMKTAAAAGMFPAGALWGFRPREELLRDGARILVEHPRAVGMLLNG